MADNGIPQMTWNIAQDLLTRGTSVWVRCGNSAADAQKVGFVDSMRGSKNLQLQRAQCCGSIVVVSIDPQGLSVQLNITGFVATKDVYKGSVEYNGGGKISLASFNPKSKDFIENQVCTKFKYLDFYDEKHNTILASFKDAISSTYTITVNGGSYVKADISMEAIDMSDGTEYLNS